LAAALAGTARGDRNAFHSLYAETSGALFALCLRILRNREAAEDTLQETYLAVWMHADQFDRTKGGALAWLIVIARNRALDRLRANPHRDVGEVSECLPDLTPGPEALLEGAQLRSGVRRQVGLLDLKSASAIETAFFEGVSYVELARRTGLPLGTVKSRIRRALLQLKQAWPEDRP
jgi:RNA polymerase sigma-70 factor (ECF subfamily)